MNQAADWLGLASYCGVAAIGALAGLAKGRGAHRGAESRISIAAGRLASAPAYAGVAWRQPAFSLSAAAYRAGPPDAAAGPADECGHLHALDPAQLNGPFSWRDAAGTVIAAGARPCSGAILVLVFALAQGLFAAGVAATFAMALGTAVTTGALAWMAVFAKSAAMRLAAGENSRLRWWRGASNSPPPSRCWRSASRCWSARGAPAPDRAVRPMAWGCIISARPHRGQVEAVERALAVRADL